MTLLKDAQVVATTAAGPDAQFEISLANVAGGNYIFSVYSEDSKGIRSSTLTFPVSVTGSVTTRVSGIFIAPTIATDKSEVRRGDVLTIFGQTAPNAEVTISVNSEEEIFIKEASDASGAYLAQFDTSVLEFGQHHTKSRAASVGQITSFGKVVAFVVGNKNVAAILPEKQTKRGDISGDGRINLVDFSIAAYWYKRSNPPATADMNGDGKVDLVDMSIMVFNWTG